MHIYLAIFLGSLITATIRAPGGLRYFQVRQTRGFASGNTSTPFNVVFRNYARISLLRPHFVLHVGNGILTVCPFQFTSSPDYLLGPDLPRSD